jgi:hypothetical protein
MAKSKAERGRCASRKKVAAARHPRHGLRARRERLVAKLRLIDNLRSSVYHPVTHIEGAPSTTPG